eukprot:s3674_g1.t1
MKGEENLSGNLGHSKLSQSLTWLEGEIDMKPYFFLSSPYHQVGFLWIFPLGQEESRIISIVAPEDRVRDINSPARGLTYWKTCGDRKKGCNFCWAPDTSESIDSPPEMTPEESLMAIKQLFEDFCGALNPSELPIAANKDLERGLQEVIQRLPGLLRVRVTQESSEVSDSLSLDQLLQKPAETDAEKSSSSCKRWSLHALEPRSKRAETERGLAMRFKRMGGPASELWKGSSQKAPGEGDEDPFPWTETEEVAWCCFSWRLVSSMNDQLKRGRFLRSWLAASHEPQRHLFESSQDLLTQRLRRVAANRVAGSSVTQKGTLVALLPHIRFLQRMWLRKALWQEQRQAERVQVDFPGKLCDAAVPKEGFRQLRAMALFVTERLKEVGIHFPQDLLARKDPLWKKGHWISQRVDGVIRNGLITGTKGSQYEVQWSDGAVTTLPETKLKTPHLWRSGEAVEVYDLSGGVYRKALVAQNFEKVKIKDMDAW